MYVGDRVLDSGGGEPGIDGVPCIAVAAANARAARSSSLLAPLDGYAALAAPRQALEASVATSRSARRPADIPRGRRGCILAWR
jgi:hypothetical protein